LPLTLANHQGQSCPQQAPHHDSREDDDGVIIVALEHMCPLVWPESHKAVKEYDSNATHKVHKNTQLLQQPYKCVRLWLRPGDVVVMNGNTIHAGDAGVPEQNAARVHYYVGKEKGNNTYPLAQYQRMRHRFANANLK
jgi:ectoine hydroxylase-related dioxygenase (phytanoyl-CoA dioxygenase family)